MHDFVLMNESIRGFLLRKKESIEKEIKKRRKKARRRKLEERNKKKIIERFNFKPGVHCGYFFSLGILVAMRFASRPLITMTQQYIWILSLSSALHMAKIYFDLFLGLIPMEKKKKTN